ncbi:ATP-binding protein [Roseateles asaccharophilus]|uniref:histidine kinase n=1 Tax=Roseateles asaccharophilus TaxID=582607 RepID=A0ABU2A3X1_9BURK|nr:ATP-binding protein [Roseateles asaccharophilus]MDR7331894.1 signal transduction histidine kinase [Roseateles asaccharophilus]
MRFVKMTWLNSLGAKILLAYVVGAVLSIVLIVATAVAIVYYQGDVVSGFDVADTTRAFAEELSFDKDGIPVGISDLDSGSEIDDGNLKALYESLKGEAAFRVLDASGRVVLSSAKGVTFWPESGPARRLKSGRFEFEHEGSVMVAATETVERDGRLWHVQFAVSKRFLHLVYEAFALPFTGVGVTLFSLVLLLVFGPCVYFTLRYALKPVSGISDAAAEISPRSLHARLPTQGVPKELAPLVDSFNRVLERVEHGYRIQQEFLATAAHELKTPIALIRAQVELSPESAQREALLGDVEHMSRHVQQLLHLAEASELQNYRPTAVDMREAVHQAASFLQRMADAADVRFELPEQNTSVVWMADRGALFTLLKNLLENAIQHTPPGSLVRAEIEADFVAIRDWGPGVPPDQMPNIFARFWRGPHRRDQGAGLGMAICREIAQAHGWTLTASQAHPGLRVVLAK